MQENHSPFGEWFGFDVVAANAEQAELRMIVEPHHLNRFGSAHGGVCMALGDHCSGALLAAMTDDNAFFATINFQCAYHKAVKPGELICVAYLTDRSKRIAHIRTEIKQAGELVASSVGAFAIREKR